MMGLLRRAQPDRAEDAAARPPAPFVVGVNRSGTTLLRLMLDAHPDLTMPPETHFVPDLIEAAEQGGSSPEDLVAVITSQREFGDLGFTPEELLELFRAAQASAHGALGAGGALRAFYEAYAAREGKSRWGEKTPAYAKSMVRIQRALPEARFVHLIRDGRDVALSRRKSSVDPPSPGRVAQRWRQRIERAREQAPRLHHYTEVRYEDLVLETEPTLRRICEFSELDFEPAMLDYHERADDRLAEMKRDLPARGQRPHQPAEKRMQIHALTREPPKVDRVYRWRSQMNDEERQEFEAEAGELLADLGYEVGAEAAASAERASV
jgi:hypothetical protein